MTYVPHMRLIINGGLPGGEKWSCSFSLAGNQDSSVNQSQQQMNDMLAQFLPDAVTWIQATGSKFSREVSLQRIDLRALDAEGRTIRLAQITPTSSTVGPSTTSMPNQCAVVLSQISGLPGARGRGRAYLPCLATGPDTGGRISAADRTSILTNARTMLIAAEAAYIANGGVQPGGLVVASGVGAGQNNKVTRLRVGDVIDTQRRRRDALVEAYSEAALIQ